MIVTNTKKELISLTEGGEGERKMFSLWPERVLLGLTLRCCPARKTQCQNCHKRGHFAKGLSLWDGQNKRLVIAPVSRAGGKTGGMTL